MRVLLAIEACGGGVGRHVIDLATGLTGRGHDVSLFYSTNRAEDSFMAALQFMPKLTKREIPMGRAVGFHDYKAYRCMREMLAEAGPFDIVHGHSSKAGALLRLAVGAGDAARVYTPHAPITMDPERSMMGRLLYGAAERALSRRCERIICVSAAERDHLVSLGIPAEKLRVVQNGIKPLAEFQRDDVRQRLGLGDNTVCFGFVGRISHQKAVNRIISAFAMAHGRMSDVHLVIVGEGPLSEDMRSLVHRFGLQREVTFTGAAVGTEMMAAFDTFVLASRYEGLPYVLIEAAASGLPIVCTDVGGARDIVDDAENGYVLAEQDVELLADRLLKLARRPELRDSMALRSLEIAADFTVDRMVDDTIRVYEELLYTNNVEQ